MSKDASEDEFANLQKRLELIQRETELIKIQLEATRAQTDELLKQNQPQINAPDQTGEAESGQNDPQG